MSIMNTQQIMDILPHRSPFLLIDTVEELEPGVPQRGFRIYENIGAYEINTECFKEFKSLRGFAAPEGIGYCLCVRK